jgi:hypothetical protein
MNDSEILKHLEKSAREDVKYFANPKNQLHGQALLKII